MPQIFIDGQRVGGLAGLGLWNLLAQRSHGCFEHRLIICASHPVSTLKIPKRQRPGRKSGTHFSKTMSKIEIGKQYQTRSGKKVRRVLCVDGINSLIPVVVEFEDGDFASYCADGTPAFGFNDEDEWGLIEVRPLHETLKRDDKVMVRDGDHQEWVRRHYSHYQNGRYYTWRGSRTSFTGDGVIDWGECRLPTPEELGAA